jgi:hypothetical protein
MSLSDDNSGKTDQSDANLFAVTNPAPVTYLPVINLCNYSGTIEIPVKVNAFNEVGALSLTIAYDSNVIVYQSFVNNSAYPGLDVDCSVPGTLVAGGFASEGIDLEDSTTLLTLVFQYLSGSTALSFVDNGTSCEYAGPPPAWQTLIDSPQDAFYLNGLVSGWLQPASAGTITGPSGNYVCAGQSTVSFTVEPITNAVSYHWIVPQGATIVGGVNTNSILVDFSDYAISGDVSVYGSNVCGVGQSSSVFVSVLAPPAAAGVISGSDTVCRGMAAVTFSVEPVLNALSYNWTLPEGAELISGQNTNSISVNFNESAVSGFMSVNGTNACFSGPSSPSFYVTIGEEPQILQQPVSPAPVIAGAGIASFLTTATGSGIAFQWQILEGDWQNINNDEIYSGVNTSELTITNPSSTMDGLYFRCRVTGYCGSDQFTDGSAKLTVIDPLGIHEPWGNPINQITTGMGSIEAILCPNPSKYDTRLYLSSQIAAQAEIFLVNPLGQISLLQEKKWFEPGIHTLTLSSGKYAPGCYLIIIRLIADKNSFHKNLKWVIE